MRPSFKLDTNALTTAARSSWAGDEALVSFLKIDSVIGRIACWGLWFGCDWISANKSPGIDRGGSKAFQAKNGALNSSTSPLPVERVAGPSSPNPINLGPSLVFLSTTTRPPPSNFCELGTLLVKWYITPTSSA